MPQCVSDFYMSIQAVRSPNTCLNYVRKLHHFLDYIDVEDISEIDALLAGVEDHGLGCHSQELANDFHLLVHELGDCTLLLDREGLELLRCHGGVNASVGKNATICVQIVE